MNSYAQWGQGYISLEIMGFKRYPFFPTSPPTTNIRLRDNRKPTLTTFPRTSTLMQSVQEAPTFIAISAVDSECSSVTSGLDGKAKGTPSKGRKCLTAWNRQNCGKLELLLYPSQYEVFRHTSFLTFCCHRENPWFYFLSKPASWTSSKQQLVRQGALIVCSDIRTPGALLCLHLDSSTT